MNFYKGFQFELQKFLKGHIKMHNKVADILRINLWKHLATWHLKVIKLRLAF